MNDVQRLFGERLLRLLEEKGISQGEFAEKMDCSRQSVNFYTLGKRSPDIALAGKMAEFFGVSCDYLIGLSDYRHRDEADLTVSEAGISADTMKFFAGLKISSAGMAQSDRGKYQQMGFDFETEISSHYASHAKTTLDLLNNLISHDAFGVLLGYVKRYRDLCHGNDRVAILQSLMTEIESPFTGKKYGDKNENEKMIKEFYLHVISKYFDEIIRDIAK